MIRESWFVVAESGMKFRLMGPPAFPQSVFVESHRIDACMEYAARHGLIGIAISPLGGFNLPDLSFLLRFPSVEHLTILHAEMLDISAISSLDRLKYLQISGVPRQAIDLTHFSQLRELRVRWWPKLQFGESIRSLEILSLSNYSPHNCDLSGLPEIPKLKNLDIVQSHRLTLSGVDRFPHLNKLTIAYLPGLTDLSPLSAFRTGVMETLEFQNCPKISNHDEVKVIQSLRRLAFNRCGKIPSLRFLDNLTVLESFSFVGTDILDGDLRPCLRLKFVGFLDKRHYSHRSSEFPSATPNRSANGNR